MYPFRVLVVDDVQAWRDVARSMLEKMPGLVVVAEASDGAEAVQKAEEQQPDLIVLDIGLPTLNGIEVARRIRPTCRASKIVFFSADRHYDAAEVGLGAGVTTYVLKSRAATDLVPAVEATLNGVLGALILG